MGNPETIRHVAIYGRVSTEHEAQLNAFDNQIEWYEDVVRQHPAWVVVQRYFDQGITGTAAEKRPEFLRMIGDAKAGKFDLIVTREVCRFARNTVDTLSYTRELTKSGVEVFFVNDGIWTFSGDGELRLSIMATLAQEESRKISERVRAGQQISRGKGVLYGTGNILGYDRIDGTYVINANQADTVRRIFNLYAGGLGYQKICTQLTMEGRLNSSGKCEWSTDRVGRILRNGTYAGYLPYNKSHSDGFLTQKRVNHREEDHVYQKGYFEPLVSEELWQRCKEIRERKSTLTRDEDGKTQKFGRKSEASVWCSKLRCSCGSTFRRYCWRQNEDGTKIYGFECYRRTRSVPSKVLREAGLEAEIKCDFPSIPGWHLDLAAKKVFSQLIGEDGAAIQLALSLIAQCGAQDERELKNTQATLLAKCEKLERKKSGLREMRALGDITREAFLTDTAKADAELETLRAQLSDLESEALKPRKSIDLRKLSKTVNAWIAIGGTSVPDALIDQLIRRITILDKTTQRWLLDLTKPQRKGIKSDNGVEKEHEPQDIFTLSITAEDAVAYCEAKGQRFFRSKWRDLNIILAI